jgi:hypothetical protein
MVSLTSEGVVRFGCAVRTCIVISFSSPSVKRLASVPRLPPVDPVSESPRQPAWLRTTFGPRNKRECLTNSAQDASRIARGFVIPLAVTQ